jgi:hypothetical protein
MRSAACLVACVTGLALFAPPLSGNADPVQDASSATAIQDEIDRLKAQVQQQQKQIDELRKRVDALQRQPEGIRSAPVVTQAPLSFELGGATLTPTRFIDFSQGGDPRRSRADCRPISQPSRLTTRYWVIDDRRFRAPPTRVWACR